MCNACIGREGFLQLSHPFLSHPFLSRHFLSQLAREFVLVTTKLKVIMCNAWIGREGFLQLSHPFLSPFFIARSYVSVIERHTPAHMTRDNETGRNAALQFLKTP